MRRFAQFFFFATILIGLGFALQQHTTLPERVATHFGPSGQPDGWMSRSAHTRSQVGIIAFIAILFATLAALLPRVPDRFVNLPHRDYWLAPARRAATFAWLRSMLYWLGALLQIFLCFIFREVWRANLAPQPALHLNSLWLQVSLFIVTAGLVITLLFRFRRPAGAR